MNLLPQASGTRPRAACEITAQGVVAARSAATAGPLEAVARVELAAGAVAPGLKPGNVADRVEVIAAIRKALEQLGLRPNTRAADITVIIPDAAVRVLLLEFDALPNKLSEALPIVRFRLKKLLPFEADDAMVTFQVMSHSRSVVRVLAVAIPTDVLADYETAVREAGFEPGSVLPSTLAALAGLDAADSTALLVNANRLGITTAIVRDGILLLHRAVDLQEHEPGLPANLPPALFETGNELAYPLATLPHATLPLVSVDDTEEEWAMQQPVPEHGRNPYADLARDEEAVQNEDGITGLPVPPVYNGGFGQAQFQSQTAPGAPEHSPFLAPTAQAELSADSHNSILYAPTSSGTLTEDRSGRTPPSRPPSTPPPSQSNGAGQQAAAVHGAEPLQHYHAERIGHEQDMAEAVSVAAAYFEDTLSAAPQRVLSAGPLGADALRRALQSHGVGGEGDGLQVRELVDSAALLSSAVTASVPRGWLAGVLGALRG